MPDSKLILVGVGGGISAYKVVEVVSRLVQNGHEVHVAMTPAAQQFVTATTFASICRRRTITEMFPPPSATDGDHLYPHLFPACRADAMLVAPATADLLAKLASGIGDDVVACSALALRPEALRLLAPAMNEHMWRQPVVQRNVETLRTLGWITVGPEEGSLACGTHGPGRMAEPITIVEALETALAARNGRLRGQRVLILSGPTREPIDAVRFISNGSTGRMGAALARAAVRAGAAVEFVTGPVEPERLPRLPGVAIHRVGTAAEMLEAARPLAPKADILIFAAAVADVRPAQPQAEKLPKNRIPASLVLEPTPDIAAELARTRRPDQVAIGFALETGEGIENARRKCEAKALDAIVLNHPLAIGAERADYTLLAGHELERWAGVSKDECARRLFDRAAEWLEQRRVISGRSA